MVKKLPEKFPKELLIQRESPRNFPKVYRRYFRKPIQKSCWGNQTKISNKFQMALSNNLKKMDRWLLSILLNLTVFRRLLAILAQSWSVSRVSSAIPIEDSSEIPPEVLSGISSTISSSMYRAVPQVIVCINSS